MYTIEIVKNKFWILEDAGVKRGIIRYVSDDIYNLTQNEKTENISLDEVKSRFGNNILSSVSKPVTRTTNKSDEKVNDYPCKHTPFNHTTMEVVDKEIDTYTKTEKSKVRYAAGYFGLHFTGVWRKAYSPKIDTLNKYTFVGPFKTPDEADATILVESRKNE